MTLSKDHRSTSDHHIDIDRCPSSSEDTPRAQEPDMELQEESTPRRRKPIIKLGAGRTELKKTGHILNCNEVDVDVSTPYVLGFLVGWFTWVFGFVLLSFGGDGRRTAALRKGLVMGVAAVTLPLAAIISIFVILIGEFKDLLRPFSDISTPKNPFSKD